MEQKNCPDPRNCSKIHYFGKCPYKHQPCNRGTSCPYVTQNNCQFYHPEEDYPQYKPQKGSGKTKKEKRKPAITPVKITPSATQLATMASKAFAEMAALQKDKPPSSTSQSNVSVINKSISTISKTMSQQQQVGTQAKASMRPAGDIGEVPIISHLTNPWGKAAKVEPEVTVEKSDDPERIPEYITTKIKKQEVYIRDLEDRIRAAETNVELHRRRAEEFESEKLRFFTCWSRAVKTLEVIRESGVYLGEGITRTIEYHSVALRKEQYASGESAQVVQKPETTSSSTYFRPYQQQPDSYQRPREGVNALGQLGYPHAEGISSLSNRGLGSLGGYHRPDTNLAERRLGQLGYPRGEANLDNNRGLGQLVGYPRTNGNQENRRSLGQLGYQVSDGANQEPKRLGQLGPGYQSLDEAGKRGLIGGYNPDPTIATFDHAPGSGFLRSHKVLEDRERESAVETSVGRNTFEQDMLLPSLDL